jgi:DNA (cytosine-5)-methyltransferase 1
MRHGSLFSGIGGFDLAAEWMGWENIFHCEWNKFGQQVLKYYWPKAISYEDITKTDFTIHRGSIDIITGGFPCQPFSVAGKQKGNEDERHLWPEMLRAIREIQPSYIVGENVGGLVSWNGGMVFEQVQAELEIEGYQVQSFILPAAGVGTIHKRDRVWVVAYNDKVSRCNLGKCNLQNRKKWSEGFGGKSWVEFQLGNSKITPIKWGSKRYNIINEPALINGSNGIPTRLDGITFSKWCEQSNGAAGNAIVPQVVHQIFKAIEEYERITTANTD